MKARFIATMLVPLLALVQSAFADARNNEAMRLLGEVYARYAALESYSDKGVVTVRSYSGDKAPLTYSKDFVTKYVAPDNLLFSWREELPIFGAKQYAVWGDSSEIKFWSTYGGLETRASWAEALSGAHGASSGVAWRVPPSLLEGCRNDPFATIVKANFMDPQPEKSHGEVQVRVEMADGSEEIMWVDEERKIISKIEFWIELPSTGNRMYTVIAYKETSIDLPISKRDLEFMPANQSLQGTPHTTRRP